MSAVVYQILIDNARVSSILGGHHNEITLGAQGYGLIGGGYQNEVNAQYGSIINGRDNIVNHDFSAIIGSQNKTTDRTIYNLYRRFRC